MDSAVTIFKVVTKIGFAFSLLSLFTVILGGLFAIITQTLAGSVIADIGKIVQIWLPFNLSPFVTWLYTIASFYVIYRITSYMYRFLSSVLE